jgi:hypothetical protein
MSGAIIIVMMHFYKFIKILELKDMFKTKMFISEEK